MRLKGGSHFHLGCIYKELGRKKEAKQHFKECLKNYPRPQKSKEEFEEIKYD